MDDASFKFLEDLLSTPGVSGYEQPVQQVVRNYAESFADEIQSDLHGNLILSKNANASMRLMYAGHCDQIGLIVTQIEESGFLYFQTIGGWDPQQLVGQRVSIWTESGEIPGVVARKAIHLQDESERKKISQLKELWIDIGATNKEDAASIVRIGDSVTLQLGMQKLRNGLASGPAMDDRTGLWVCVEAMRRASDQLDCALFVASTVQEEIGLRGAKTAAFTIDPHIGIAVDVTHATDCPTIDKRQQGEVSLGSGPVVFRGPNMNPKVVQRLISTSDATELPYQLSALGRAAPNDSNSLQINRGGVASGLVAIPNRYMHSAVETIALSDIDHAADLLAAFANSIKSQDDFRP